VDIIGDLAGSARVADDVFAEAWHEMRSTRVAGPARGSRHRFLDDFAPPATIGGFAGHVGGVGDEPGR
jgi:hypothetical protein